MSYYYVNHNHLENLLKLLYRFLAPFIPPQQFSKAGLWNLHFYRHWVIWVAPGRHPENHGLDITQEDPASLPQPPRLNSMVVVLG